MIEKIYAPKKYIKIAEAGRGFAAFYVFIFHIIKFTQLREISPEGSIQYYLALTFGNYGHQAVLFFFLLSGFSIHYTSIDRPLNSLNGVFHYYYLRIRRIYPIYLLAIILTLMLLSLGYYLYPEQYAKEYELINPGVILYNLFFLDDRYYVEGILAPALPTNGPLWSLSYEVLYYLIYPIFWYLSLKMKYTRVIIPFAILSIFCISYAHYYHPNHLTNVLSLYIVWVMGATIAYIMRQPKLIKSSLWLYFVIAIYVLLQSVWVLENATYTLGVYYDILWGVLFFVVMLYFAIVEELDIKYWQRWFVASMIIIGVIFIDAITLFIDISKDMGYFYLKIHFSAIIFLVIALVPKFNIRKIVHITLRPFERMGFYSYGLYIIHYPLLFFISALLLYHQWSLFYALLFIPPIMFLAKAIEGPYQAALSKAMDKVVLNKK
ncbi:MAG TPA: acyltransferase [Gammaproteobacteria bacterium]